MQGPKKMQLDCIVFFVVVKHQNLRISTETTFNHPLPPLPLWRHCARMSREFSPDVRWKWKWSDGVWKWYDFDRICKCNIMEVEVKLFLNYRQKILVWNLNENLIFRDRIRIFIGPMCTSGRIIGSQTLYVCHSTFRWNLVKTVNVVNVDPSWKP